MNKKEFLLCIDDCDKDHHAISGAVCTADKIGIIEGMSLAHLREVAYRRNHPDYLSFSDEEVLATSLSPEQMAKFKDFFKQIPDLPAEFIRPFKPFESSEPAEITELIKPTEIFEPSEVIESFAS